MKKVLKFVKGKREEKKDGLSNIGVSPRDQFNKLSASRPTNETSTAIEHSCGYSVYVNGKDKSLTKLHKAAWQGNLEKVKAALKRADINVTDKSNRTPLHLAAARGHSNVVSLLRHSKADTNIRDGDGKIPLLKAVESGTKEAVGALLEGTFDVNSVDNNGNSTLHITAKKGFYEISSMLLEKGVNIEISNNAGELPLHLATQAEHNELVELFLRYGASVNSVDSNNRSPLMLAARNGNMSLIKLFLEYGAQRCITDCNNMTAEDYAFLEGYHEVAVELKKSATLNTFIPQSSKAERQFSRSVEKSASLTTLPKHSQKDKEEEKGAIAVNEKFGEEKIRRNDIRQLKEENIKLQNTALILQDFEQTSDDELSEESGKDMKTFEKREEDSPRSCIIPPPCKPPRSWDFIQSGVMDDHNGQEPRRLSLLTLGSLRTKKENFIDSPSFKRDVHESEGYAKKNCPQFGSKFPSATEHCTDDIKKSVSESDWDSDDSLPIDNCGVVINNGIGSTEASEAVLKHRDGIEASLSLQQKKSFVLVRTNSIDLSDDYADKSGDKPTEDSMQDGRKQLINLKKEVHEENEDVLNLHKKSDEGTLGRDGTLMGYEEIWEANARISRTISESPASNSVLNGQKATLTIIDNSGKREISESIGRGSMLLNITENKPILWNTCAEVLVPNLTEDAKEDTLLFKSPCLDQRSRALSNYETVFSNLKMTEASDSKNTIFEKVKIRNNKTESRSMDALDGKLTSVGGIKETKMTHFKRHSHHQSISVPSWNKSEELYEKQFGTNLDQRTVDNGHIKAQLKCYDEALQELAQAPFIKKQSSLPLPQKNEAWDPIVSQFSGSKGHHYLSLPRTNELIDEAFKEIGKSSVKLKQGSLSLPRTATSKDMISDVYPTLSHVSKKGSQKRRRAESEGEMSSAPHKESSKILGSYTSKFEKPRVSSDSSLTTPIEVLGIVNRNYTQYSESLVDEHSMSSGRESLSEKPLRKKRGILLAMRCLMGHNYESVNGNIARNVTVEETASETVLAMNVHSSNEKHGPHSDKVRPNISEINCEKTEKNCVADEPNIVEDGNKLILLRSLPDSGKVQKYNKPTDFCKDLTKSDTSTTEERLLQNNCFDSQQTKEPAQQSESTTASTPFAVLKETFSQKDSPSDAESEHSQLDITPQHPCLTDAADNQHEVLKKHLQNATIERGQLQQTAVELEEKAERLRYELADAHEAAKSQDQIVVLLQKQLSYMESLHACCLEEMHHHQLRIANLEQELMHLQDICHKQQEEKIMLQEIMENKDTGDIQKAKASPSKDLANESFPSSEDKYASHHQEDNTDVQELTEPTEVDVNQEERTLPSDNTQEEKHPYFESSGVNNGCTEESRMLEKEMKLLNDSNEESRQRLNVANKRFYAPHELKSIIMNEFEALLKLKEQLKAFADQLEGMNDAEVLKCTAQEELQKAIDVLKSSCGNVESIGEKCAVFGNAANCDQYIHLRMGEPYSYEEKDSLLCGLDECERNSTPMEESQTGQDTEAVKNEFVAHLVELKELTEVHDTEIYNIIQKLALSGESSGFLTELIANLEEIKEKSSALCLQVECVIDLLHMNDRKALELILLYPDTRERYSVKECCSSIKIERCHKHSFSLYQNETKPVAEREGIGIDSSLVNIELIENSSLPPNEPVKENKKSVCFSGNIEDNVTRSESGDVLLESFKENIYPKSEVGSRKQLLTIELPEYKLHSRNEKESINDILAENANLKCELQKAKFEFEELEKELKDMMLQKCAQLLVTDETEMMQVKNVTSSANTQAHDSGFLKQLDNTSVMLLNSLSKTETMEKASVGSIKPITALLITTDNDDCERHSDTCFNETDIGIAQNTGIFDESIKKHKDLTETSNQETWDMKTKKNSLCLLNCLENNNITGSNEIVPKGCVESKSNDTYSCTLIQQTENMPIISQEICDINEQTVHDSSSELKANQPETKNENCNFSSNLNIKSIFKCDHCNLCGRGNSKESEPLKSNCNCSLKNSSKMEVEGELMNSDEKRLAIMQECCKISINNGVMKSEPNLCSGSENVNNISSKDNVSKLSEEGTLCSDINTGNTNKYAVRDSHSSEHCKNLGEGEFKCVGDSSDNKNILPEKCESAFRNKPNSIDSGNSCKGNGITNNGTSKNQCNQIFIPMTNNVQSTSASVLKKSANGTTYTSKNEISKMSEMPMYHRLNSCNQLVGKQFGLTISKSPKFLSDRDLEKRNVSFYNKFSKMSIDGSDSFETSTTGGSSDTESEYRTKTSKFRTKVLSKTQEIDCESICSQSSDSTLCHEETEPEEACERNGSSKIHSIKFRRFNTVNNKTHEKENYLSKFTKFSEESSHYYQKGYIKEHHQAEMKEKSSLNYSSSETCSSSPVSRVRQCHMNSKRDIYLGRQSRIPTYVKPFTRRGSASLPVVNIQYSKSDNTCSMSKITKTLSERNSSDYLRDNNLENKLRRIKNAATNTAPGENFDLQNELHIEREKVRKHAICIRRLKSELQLMKNSMAENKKTLVFGYNSHSSRQRSSSASAPHSPHHSSFTAPEFHPQDMFNIEKELMLLQSKLENDFVSKAEMDLVKKGYEAALAKARQDAELSVYDNLRTKLHQMNIFFEKQTKEQSGITHTENKNESQMKQEFQEITLKILSDFSKVQATLQEKGEKEKELKEKYEKLIKECEKEQEKHRRKLIEKSYSVNLTPHLSKKIKDMNSKSSMMEITTSQRTSSLPSLGVRHVPVPIATLTSAENSAWVPEDALNYILHRDIEETISKTSPSATEGSAVSNSPEKPVTANEEQLDILRMKYFVY